MYWVDSRAADLPASHWHLDHSTGVRGGGRSAGFGFEALSVVVFLLIQDDQRSRGSRCIVNSASFGASGHRYRGARFVPLKMWTGG
jgi:hypothetical protein